MEAVLPLAARGLIRKQNVCRLVRKSHRTQKNGRKEKLTLKKNIFIYF